MSRSITARKLWENGTFVGKCATIFAFPCGRFTGSTPRLGYLIPLGGCCGNPEGYSLSMEDPYPGDDAAKTLNGIITGIWLEFDGNGTLIDATTVADVVDECNACCDDTESAVTAKYSGVFPTKADVSATTWTIVRADNGGVLDLQRFMLDYLGKYVEGTLSRTLYAGGNSTYVFQAVDDIHAIGADAATETARTFDSNAPGAIAGTSHYIANGVINGVTLPTLDDDAYNALSDVATAATGNTTWASFGTWSVVAGKLRLTSTTAVAASIVLTTAAD